MISDELYRACLKEYIRNIGSGLDVALRAAINVATLAEGADVWKTAALAAAEMLKKEREQHKAALAARDTEIRSETPGETS